MQGAAGSVLAIVAVVASLIAGGGASSSAPSNGSPPTKSSSSSPVLPTTLPTDAAQLASDLNLAQQIIDDRSSSATDLTTAGRLIQLATHELRTGPLRAQHATLADLNGRTAATFRANLAASAALAQLNTPRKSLPPWRIIQPPAPDTLLSYFKAAQARFGVPWRYLAAIELIETQFGRVDGLSTAGAEGPMQFMPATWAAYGSGNVHDPRDAIFGAARYLVANGAPANIPAAIYHYNPSGYYVRAVEAYATRMWSDPRSFYGYYYWRVIFADRSGRFILPLGFPKVRAIPLR
jgi:membrane-bound lytic murein transglycosylase B